MVGATGAFLHPFDDRLLWHGHASQVDEVVRTGLRPDAVVQGLRRQGCDGIPIVAVETAGVVFDHCALSACERFLADHRILVEPACGASLSVVYEQAPALERFKAVLVVVCGGATTTVEQIQQCGQSRPPELGLKGDPERSGGGFQPAGKVLTHALHGCAGVAFKQGGHDGTVFGQRFLDTAAFE